MDTVQMEVIRKIQEQIDRERDMMGRNDPHPTTCDNDYISKPPSSTAHQNFEIYPCEYMNRSNSCPFIDTCAAKSTTGHCFCKRKFDFYVNTHRT